MNRGACARTCPYVCTSFVLPKQKTRRGLFCQNCQCREDRHVLLTHSEQLTSENPAKKKHQNLPNSSTDVSSPSKISSLNKSNDTTQCSVNVTAEIRHMKTSQSMSHPFNTNSLNNNGVTFSSVSIHTDTNNGTSPAPRNQIPVKTKVVLKRPKTKINVVIPKISNPSGPISAKQNETDSVESSLESESFTVKQGHSKGPLPTKIPWNLTQEITAPIAHCSKQEPKPKPSPKRKCFLSAPADDDVSPLFSESELNAAEKEIYGEDYLMGPYPKCVKVSDEAEEGPIHQLVELKSAFDNDQFESRSLCPNKFQSQSECPNDFVSRSEGPDELESQSQCPNEIAPQNPPFRKTLENNKAKAKVTKHNKIAQDIKTIVEDSDGELEENDGPVLRTMRQAITKYCKAERIKGSAKVLPQDPKGIVPLPELSNSVLQVLASGNDDDVLCHFDDIVEEVAHYLVPLPCSTTRDYKNFGMAMVAKYPAIGTCTLVENYNKKKWEELGEEGEPGDEWPREALEAKRQTDREQLEKELAEERQRGANPPKRKVGKTKLMNTEGKEVIVVDHPHNYSYFNRLLSLRVRHLRSIRRDNDAVETILAHPAEGLWTVVEDIWPMRTKMPSKYTATEEGFVQEISAEMAKEKYDSQRVLQLFTKCFKMRTSFVSNPNGLDAIFDHFPVLKSSLYVKFEAQLMLGEEKYRMVLNNANILFDKMKKLRPTTGGCGWETFIETMRTVTQRPKELREINCGGDTLGSTPDKFPHLIAVKLPNKTLEQVIVRVGTQVIMGCSGWEDGVLVLMMAYLVFGFKISKQSHIIRCLAWLLFGLEKEKNLVNQASMRLKAVLKIV